MAWGAAAGAAVVAWIGVTGATALTVAAVTAAAVNGLIVGAVIGAATSALSGGNIFEGALKGAVLGGITGGVAGYVSSAISGLATVAEGAGAAADLVDAEIGASMTMGAGVDATDAAVGAAMAPTTDAAVSAAPPIPGETPTVNLGEPNAGAANAPAGGAQTPAEAAAQKPGLLSGTEKPAPLSVEEKVAKIAADSKEEMAQMYQKSATQQAVSQGLGGMVQGYGAYKTSKDRSADAEMAVQAGVDAEGRRIANNMPGITPLNSKSIVWKNIILPAAWQKSIPGYQKISGPMAKYKSTGLIASEGGA